ncbi:MAG: menaquinone biosynthesis protein [Verrucomicrobia bacterium]|nr:menaquinone biosynthesis protein [Verrucomicrobiota bacterium]
MNRSDHKRDSSANTGVLNHVDSVGIGEKYRIGSVPYLNAAPLTRGIEDTIIFAPPSRLAEMLRNNELDAALVSVTETLFNETYDILDGAAIASLGEVQSVLLAHRGALEDIQTVYCDTASLASFELLRVLLAERNKHPEFKPFDDYRFETVPDNLMLIGDQALDFLRRNRTHRIWDLGAAWTELTRLPFIYAAWALRRESADEELKRFLRDAKAFGVDTLDYIISSRTEFDYEFRKDYLSWHIHYHLGDDEKRGLSRFADLLRKHGRSPVFTPRFV